MTIDARLLARCDLVYEFAAQQLRHLIETYPDRFPMYTVEGKWMHGGEAWTNWCEGFLGGQLWLLHEHTSDAYWREARRALLATRGAPQDGPHRP